ncbi:PREDICTED: acyl-protein thioesterase 1-like isoform X2 [Priapulus caudatus]|uniref:palmitoyl-protein hydrolase n=1 Tax=Priapulus caudatus TaxID=37621 RepID=A0ABM1DWU9_PRICU|nr:PREDICTED: acyl-protein thioesterase 1-like isoform X2 [Priapulus caudatus]
MLVTTSICNDIETGRHGWAAGLAEIKPAYLKCVCPNAPTMPVTLNAGFRMPSWFDIYTLQQTSMQDEEGIKKAAENLHTLIDEEEKKGIPSNRIMVGGFSQGGAVSIYAALTYKKPLGGLLMLSSWLPLSNQFPEIVKGNTETAIFQAHGDVDPVVPFAWGELTGKKLKTFVKNYEFKSYAGLMHSSCPQEMDDVKQFINKHLPPV